MQGLSLTAIVIGIGTGMVIGGHGNLLNLVSRVFGAIRASLLLNVVTGLASGLLVLIMVANGGFPVRELPRQTLLLAIIAGLIGMLIVAGGAYALPRLGLALGAATFIAGQMTIGAILDTTGLTGGEPIPLDGRRILGLLVMAVAVYLLVPRNG